jgi:hypothetical protein
MPTFFLPLFPHVYEVGAISHLDKRREEMRDAVMKIAV